MFISVSSNTYKENHIIIEEKESYSDEQDVYNYSLALPEASLLQVYDKISIINGPYEIYLIKNY